MKLSQGIGFSILVLCVLSGCVARNNPGMGSSGKASAPALEGYAPPTTALPPPSDYQENSAIAASNMLPPPRR
jgi:hypothetical protein